MPKHPFSPPFKSTLVVSKSKDFEKHMTTIPKPIITSKWQSWNMKLLRENKLLWYPSEYENILDYLVDKWIDISEKVFEKMKAEERKLIFVYYDSSGDITKVKNWDIKAEDLEKHEPFSKFKWLFDRNKPEYLIYRMTKEMQEEITSDEGHKRIRVIIDSVLKILLANS
ncbi:MAG: hypothetical protein HeimAB125_10220 [Candidatus Heimdallarchaeota archaeon AB_125]|nr:MAG: hypothetical protein HeimAB125_10220 [Candidatus Heimdallarchaeota archaeon AB_125]